MSYYGWKWLRRYAELEEEAEFWTRWQTRLHPDEIRAIAADEIDVIKRPIRPEWPVGEWMEIRSNFAIRPSEPQFTRRGPTPR